MGQIDIVTIGDAVRLRVKNVSGRLTGGAKGVVTKIDPSEIGNPRLVIEPGNPRHPWKAHWPKGVIAITASLHEVDILQSIDSDACKHCV